MNLRTHTKIATPVSTDEIDGNIRVNIISKGRTYKVVKDSSGSCSNCDWDENFHAHCPDMERNGWTCDQDDEQYILTRIN